MMSSLMLSSMLRRVHFSNSKYFTTFRRLLNSTSPNTPHLDISKSDLKDLPLLKFPGKICVLNNTAGEERFKDEINQICQADVVGFDMETNSEKPSLVQISTENLCLLWRMRKFSNAASEIKKWISPTLTNILMSPDILKVGHGSTGNVINLLKRYQLELYNFSDTLQLANCLGLEQLSLKALVGTFLQHSLSNNECTSNWESLTLTKEQLMYASTNAWASLKVYHAIMKRMTETGIACPPPVRRAWNLLNPKDQQIILDKMSGLHDNEKNNVSNDNNSDHDTHDHSMSNSDNALSSSDNSLYNHHAAYSPVTVNKQGGPVNKQEGPVIKQGGPVNKQGGPVYERVEYERKVIHRWYQHRRRENNLSVVNARTGQNTLPPKSLSSNFPDAPLLDVTKSDLKALPLLKFPGKVCVLYGTADEEKFQNEIDQMCQADVLGFDTESRSDSNVVVPTLVQLSTDDTCILWKIRIFDGNTGNVERWISPTLVNLLNRSDILKVGHASVEDSNHLLKVYNLEMCNFQDTLKLARNLKLNHLSLKGLVGVFLGHYMSKKECTSNWGAPVLRDGQITYASTDAWASLKVYQSLVKYMKDKGVTCPPPIRRAWNVLKPYDQMKLTNRQKKSENTDTSNDHGSSDCKTDRKPHTFITPVSSGLSHYTPDSLQQDAEKDKGKEGDEREERAAEKDADIMGIDFGDGGGD